MKQKIVTFFFILSFSYSCIAQEFGKYLDNIYVQTGIGVSGSLSKFKSGQLSDDLIRMNNTEFNYNLVSFTFEFKHNWNLNLELRRTFHSQPNEYSYGFVKELEQEYEGIFYVEQGSKFPHKRVPFHNRTLQLYGGIGKRIEVGKIILTPSIFAGTRTIELSYFTNVFKKVQSNVYVDYTIVSNHYKEGESNFIRTFEMAPELKVGYAILDNLELNAAVRYSYFQLDLEFDEYITNLYTGEVDSRTFKYDKHNHFYNLALAITFTLY